MITEEFLRENAKYIEVVFNRYLGNLSETKFILCEKRDPYLDKLCCIFEIDDQIKSLTNKQILEMHVMPAIAAVAREIGKQTTVWFAKLPEEPEMVGQSYVTFNGLIPFRIVIQNHRVSVVAAVDSG